jgi:hypothetical protein
LKYSFYGFEFPPQQSEVARRHESFFVSNFSIRQSNGKSRDTNKLTHILWGRYLPVADTENILLLGIREVGLLDNDTNGYA